MKNSFYAMLFLFLPSVVFAQNLVPNPGFEEHKTCEFIISAIDTSYVSAEVVAQWCSGNLQGSPDYFNSCQIYSDLWHCSVPGNKNGFQYPFSGEAYAGIAITSFHSRTVEAREYIQAKLIKKLDKGKSYCVGFYTSFTSLDSITEKIYSTSINNNSMLAAKNWGLMLSAARPLNLNNETNNPTNPSLDTAIYVLHGEPQIKVNTFIKDTTNWTLVAGTYVAQGDEEWLTIGNFNPFMKTPVDTFYKGGYGGVSYYYIDNVFVIPSSDGGLLPSDTSVCSSWQPFQIAAFDGFKNYQWSNGDTTQRITISATGSYSVSATYEGCTLRDTMTVKEASLPLLDLPKLVYCESLLPKQFIPSNAAQFSSFNWSNGETTPLVTIFQEGNYILSAQSKCGETIDTLSVKVEKKLNVDLGIDFSICKDGVIETAALKNISNLPNYTWSNGEKNDKITINRPGIYSLISTNSCGSFRDDILIGGCLPKIYVPNAFYPDSEYSENATFRAFTQNIEILSMQIFGRWGSLMYSNQGNNIGWDGTCDGKKCSEGVYVYVIKYKDELSGKIEIKGGDVTLFR